MDLSRREWLVGTAALLSSQTAWSTGTRRALLAPAADGATAKPIVLCWNENPYGPSPAARAVIQETILSACRYPDEDIDQLIGLLARTEGFSADHIVTGSGSGELLCALGLLHGHD